MKNKILVMTLALGFISVSSIAATTSGWWRTVSVQVSASTPADHNEVCARAESSLRAQYSDVTEVRLSPSFDMYTGTLYCKATGQTQQ
ncbi:hypothetical protein C7Y70_00570 [Pseudoalteromonas sp. KS88]|uniref:hypothetical protein n=1 Tax=Pseudoalteromonas sp. KS88 TaxID=2109918 RepID=UPI001080F592|nr:hypothetical protein [Pseudoalteromonas sp. KS88]TGE85749.1 hypothetical protein C7Y70_00570 [Pseudoalteromonas sp. KS88]